MTDFFPQPQYTFEKIYYTVIKAAVIDFNPVHFVKFSKYVLMIRYLSILCAR